MQCKVDSQCPSAILQMRHITFDLFTSEIVDLLCVHFFFICVSKARKIPSLFNLCVFRRVCEGLNFPLAFKTMSFKFRLHLYTRMRIAKTDGS